MAIMNQYNKITGRHPDDTVYREEIIDILNERITKWERLYEEYRYQSNPTLICHDCLARISELKILHKMLK